MGSWLDFCMSFVFAYFGAAFSIHLVSSSEPTEANEEIISKNPEIQDAPEIKWCGRKYDDPFSGRIVNGEEAEASDFPWMAKILQDGFHMCGGTLIADRYVLSAGHCFTDYNTKNSGLPRALRGDEMNYEWTTKADELSVNFGDTAYEETNTPVQKRVLEIILDPNYDTFVNHGYVLQTDDIALLRIEPVRFSQFAIPVCLPKPDETVPDNSPLILAGWGLMKEPPEVKSVEEATIRQMEFKSPTSLMKTTLNKISWEECQNDPNIGMFLDPSFNMTDRHIICLIGNDTDTCQGDSGGGAIQRTPEDNYVLQGIVSWGIGCNRPNQPGAYTRVASYVGFILANTKDGSYLPMKPVINATL